MRGYREDVAYIHDSGFTDFARDAAPGLLDILRRHGVRSGLVVDLGCGSGLWARELNRAGYEVQGVDQSLSMIRIARRVAPQASFRVASLATVELPACHAITSIGECLNYNFDQRNSRVELRRLFRRAYSALHPGGVFIFDIAEPHRIPQNPEKKWSEGPDWAILVSIEGERARAMLRRRIVTFRRIRKAFRRSEETHLLRLYAADDLVTDLTRCGFRARKLKAYGRFQFPRGIAGILAVKPHLG
ncbi:MAG TPA: methyltransferase domain-containing protein [Bryobacteraceae bacterium]|nr:methyltransferase domain-containing protein [Bryobacteraceae bacterium]